MRNAFNDAVIAELTAAFRELGADASLRAIVLGGHGKAFCAGADLNWMRAMADYSWEQNRADAQALADMLCTLYTCPLPVVGRMHGDCYAGGVGLASVCDVLVAAEGMHFCLSEARLGLLPATIGPYVVRALGEQASRRYFITAERFSAAEAHRARLRARAVRGRRRSTPRSTTIVQALVANGPAAVKACKKLVQDVAGQPMTPELRADTARRIADIRASDEGREGVQSFLQKRTPRWQATSEPRPVNAMNLDTTQLVALAAALGWASGLRLYAVVFLTGLAGFLGWVTLPSGLQVLQHPVVLGAVGLDAGGRVLRRQDPRSRLACGTRCTPSSASRPAWRSRPACSAATPRRGRPWRRCWAARWPPPSHAAKATTRAAANTSPEPFSNIGLSLLGDAAVPAMLWLAWEHPVWFFVGLALTTAVMLALIVVLFRFLRALLRRWRGEPAAGCIVSAMRLRRWIVAATRARMGRRRRLAQNAPAEEPVLAQDLHEQVLRLPVTVKDSFGRAGDAPRSRSPCSSLPATGRFRSSS